MEKNKRYDLLINDKNGNKIFYLDKIKFGKHEGVIRYNIDHCNFIISWDDGSTRQLTSHFAKTIEVIGSEFPADQLN
ncbi:MAG: hypothetical protein IIU46_00385 [Treponema sp.]|nr:hypothetical protein [Treponema sp.]